jgi:hypothetical protein
MRQHVVLVAAGDGAIMAGPVGTTPPMLDGGEWTHLLDGGTTQPRAQGVVRLVPESLAREKAKPTRADRWRLILSTAFQYFLRGKVLGSTARLAEATG